MIIDKLSYYDVITGEDKKLRENQSLYLVLSGSSYHIRAFSAPMQKFNKDPFSREESVWMIDREEFFNKIEKMPQLVSALFPNNTLTGESLTNEVAEACFGKEPTNETAIPINRRAIIDEETRFKISYALYDIDRECLMMKDSMSFLLNCAATLLFEGVSIDVSMQKKINNAFRFLHIIGADLNEIDQKGEAMAHFYARKDNVWFIDAAYRWGANLNVLNQQGETPAYVAALHGNSHALEALHSANANLKTPATNGKTPLFVAAEKDHYELFKIFKKCGVNLNQINGDGKTLIELAVEKDDIEGMKALQKCGVNLNQIGSDGKTLAHIAARNNNPRVINFLYKNQYYVDRIDNNGETPAAIAAQEGNGEVLRALKKAGVKLTQVNQEGKTLAHIAAEAGKSAVLATLCSLEDSSHILNVPDNAGFTPIFYATRNNDVETMNSLRRQQQDSYKAQLNQNKDDCNSKSTSYRTPRPSPN